MMNSHITVRLHSRTRACDVYMYDVNVIRIFKSIDNLFHQTTHKNTNWHFRNIETEETNRNNIDGVWSKNKQNKAH